MSDTQTIMNPTTALHMARHLMRRESLSYTTTTTHPIPLLDRDRMPIHVKDYLIALALNGQDVQKTIIALLEKAAKAKGFKPSPKPNPQLTPSCQNPAQ